MPIPGTVQVTGTLAPTDITDTYPVIDPIYGIDGLRSVQSIADRNNIPIPRRREGMIVYVRDDSKYYKLNSDLTTWTDFGTNLGGASFNTVTATISPSSYYDIVIGLTSSYRYGKFIFHSKTSSKWYTSEIIIGKDQNDLSIGFTQSEYGIVGQIDILSQLVIVGPNLIFRVTNNELISLDLELTEIFSV
jgi:hypothetical protein